MLVKKKKDLEEEEEDEFERNSRNGIDGQTDPEPYIFRPGC